MLVQAMMQAMGDGDVRGNHIIKNNITIIINLM
jgi:hypothetical protein